MNLPRFALVIVAAAALSACGSSNASSVAAIGKTTNLGGINLTLQQFDDPAHGSGAQNTPPAGNQFVAIQFQMSNPASQAQGLSADDFALIGSNGQTYQSYYGHPLSVTGCPKFDNPDSTGYPRAWNVGANATVSDCAVFEIPHGVKVRRVVWGFGGSFAPGSTTLVWTISH